MADKQMTGAGQPERAQPLLGLSVTSTTVDGVRVLTPAGEIDYHTVDRLRQVLDVTGVAAPRVVVDLHRVTFMDSSGINVLIATHHAVTRAGGWLRLAAPVESVLRIIEMVGLDTVIDCRPTLRQALSL